MLNKELKPGICSCLLGCQNWIIIFLLNLRQLNQKAKCLADHFHTPTPLGLR